MIDVVTPMWFVVQWIATVAKGAQLASLKIDREVVKDDDRIVVTPRPVGFACNSGLPAPMECQKAASFGEIKGMNIDFRPLNDRCGCKAGFPSSLKVFDDF